MSMFILWFSHRGVILFTHRQFGFIIISVNKTHFLHKIELTSMQVADLLRFLQVNWAFPALFMGPIIKKDCENLHTI